jgi:uncharacterized protein (DUF302 family)
MPIGAGGFTVDKVTVQMPTRSIALTLALLILPGLCAGANPEKVGAAWIYSADSSFEFAKEDLVSAIEGRGLVISYVSHPQDMLSRTADAVEGSRSVYGDAEILLFCKADLSHRLVGANPHNIVLCPYAIAVYTLAGEPETTYLAFRSPPPDNEAYQPIEELLKDIVEEAIGQTRASVDALRPGK